MTLQELGNVEVTTVSKEPEEVWDTPAAIYVLTSEDIRRSGAKTIPDLLRLIPGVEVAQIDSNQWAVGIRGFGSAFSKSVLVLIDGRSVYTPLFAGVYWDTQNVPLADIDRIEVIRGPGGVIWGSNAVNGVINIITKNANDTRGTYASGTVGNVEQGDGTVQFGGGIGQNLAYRVYAMGFGRNNEYHSDRNNFDSWQLGQAGFRMDWNTRPRDSFTLEGDLYKGNVGELKGIGILSPPAQVNVAGYWDVSGGNLTAHWRHEFSDGSDLQAQAYYDRTYRLGVQLGEARNTFDADFQYHRELGDRNDVIVGAGIRLSPSDFIQVVPTANFLPHHQSYNLYSTFAQDQISIVPDRLSLTLGSKFEHNIYTGWEVQPSARLLWTPTPVQTLWAAVTRAVRTPSRIDTDLSLTGVVPGPTPVYVTIAGNPNFVSETLLGYEVGYRHLIAPHLYVDVAGFWNKYNDLTSFGPLSLGVGVTPVPHVQFTVPWANGIAGTTKGGEIAPDWQATSWLRLRASYSYVILKLHDRPGFTDTGTVLSDERSTPRNEADAQAFVNLPGSFEFDPDFRYVGALPAISVKAYSTMDVRLARHITPDIELSFVGRNLFQPFHYEFSGNPGPLVGIKRGFYGEITWSREAP